MYLISAGVLSLLGSVALAQGDADAPVGITTVFGDTIAPISDYAVGGYDEPSYCYGEYTYDSDYSLEVPEVCSAPLRTVSTEHVHPTRTGCCKHG